MKEQRNFRLRMKTEGYFSQSRPEMLPFVPHQAARILDVGCGEGWFGSQIKQRQNAEVWGIELEPQAGKAAGKKLDKVLIGDLMQIINELPEAYFDCIALNDILEHLVDPFYVLQVLRTKLSANGILVCSLPNVRFLGVLKDLLLKKQWRYTEGYVLDKTHLRFFTQKSILEIMDNLGYEVLSLQGINGIKSFKFTLLNLLTFGFLSDARYLQFACVAKPKEPRHE